MKQSIKTLTSLLALAPLALCAVPSPDGCAGWRPVQADSATVDFLAQNDPDTLKAMIGHQETGTARGCW